MSARSIPVARTAIKPANVRIVTDPDAPPVVLFAHTGEAPDCLKTGAFHVQTAAHLLTHIRDVVLEQPHDPASSAQIEPILIGGWLRDRLWGRTANDVDIKLDARPFTHGSPEKLEAVTLALASRLQNLPGVEGLRVVLKPERAEDGRTQQSGRIYFSYGGERISLILRNEPHTLDSCAVYGSETVSAIAMDRHGCIKAHPQFASDMRDGILRLRVIQDARKTLKRLAKFADMVRDGFVRQIIMAADDPAADGAAELFSAFSVFTNARGFPPARPLLWEPKPNG